MDAGDIQRFTCDDCGTEFEVTKVEDSPDETLKLKPQYCPFCSAFLPE